MILDSIENKKRILFNFLKISKKYGWGESSVCKALEENNNDPSLKNLIFEDGVFSVTEFFIDENNKKLEEKIIKIYNFEGLKIREKISISLLNLFELELGNTASLYELKQFYKSGAKPLLSGIKHAYKISDFIWFLIKDKSTDYNFYTKRLILSKIILKTFFAFLKDNNLVKIRLFIDLEVEKVMKIEKFKSRIKGLFKSK
jgi:ubiquinone biosynthesis protein COQ9